MELKHKWLSLCPNVPCCGLVCRLGNCFQKSTENRAGREVPLRGTEERWDQSIFHTKSNRGYQALGTIWPHLYLVVLVLWMCSVSKRYDVILKQIKNRNTLAVGFCFDVSFKKDCPCMPLVRVVFRTYFFLRLSNESTNPPLDVHDAASWQLPGIPQSQQTWHLGLDPEDSLPRVGIGWMFGSGSILGLYWLNAISTPLSDYCPISLETLLPSHSSIFL